MQWGKTVPESRPGVYVIAVVGQAGAGCEIAADYLPPAIRKRWLSNQPIVYIGCTTRPLAVRISEFYGHVYGMPSPHRGGQDVLLLTCDRWVYWATAEDPAGAEEAMIGAFLTEARHLPFANKKRSKSASKLTKGHYAHMNIKKVGVLGCGLMGSGIAQVAATAGFDVTVLEQEQKFLDKGFAGIEKSLTRLVERGPEKGGLTPAQKTEAQSHLKGTLNMQDLADCDIVIEAIIENVAEKRKTYAQLDAIVKKDAIFASNTSSISITELMTATKRPERFIGLHFFNPVPMMKLVEVVKTIATAPEVYDTAVEFGARLGKVPLRTSDKTGFIVNRLLVPYLLDAIRAYEEGVGSITDIDEAMKLGCGYPMGPFTLLDFVGLDTTYYITHVMYDEFKERRFASPPLLKRLVMAGWYGRKSGKGFYDYSDVNNPKPNKL